MGGQEFDLGSDSVRLGATSVAALLHSDRVRPSSMAGQKTSLGSDSVRLRTTSAALGSDSVRHV